MAWTFDPMQALNANLNLEHLGAIGVKYYRDFYGKLGGDLAGELATDRLLALWRLRVPQVLERLDGKVASPPPEMETAVALASEAGEPLEPALGLSAPRIGIAAPESANSLFARERDLARRWRMAQRSAFSTYLAKGYVATRFVEGSYHLERIQGQTTPFLE